MKAYLNLEDVDQIYIRLTGTDRKINSFNARVKKVAIKKNGAYIFMDEPALFDFCKEYFKDELTVRKIYSFGELMQYVF